MLWHESDRSVALIHAKPTAYLAFALLMSCRPENGVNSARSLVPKHLNCNLAPEGSAAPGDTDFDDVCDDEDNCREFFNPLQDDIDLDNIGTGCDPCRGLENTIDFDVDGWCVDLDCDDSNKDANPELEETCDGFDTNCDGVIPPDEADDDLDTRPNCADRCEGNDASGDRDADGICNDRDACRGLDSTGDSDGDRVCDDLDRCTGNDAIGDDDFDGVCEDLDECFGLDSVGDSDADGLCNDSDPCVGSSNADADGDGVCDELDQCEGDDSVRDGDEDHFCADRDCDDLNPAVFPGAAEICNRLDDDCDSLIDSPSFVICGDSLTCVLGECTENRACFADVDGDGLGDARDAVVVAPTVDCADLGRVANAADCDDTPTACGSLCGNLAELCDGFDNDCNGTVDDQSVENDHLVCGAIDHGALRCLDSSCVAFCDTGWQASAGTCADVDECSNGVVCPPDEQCENLAGSFRCVCVEGYSRDQDGADCSPVCGDGLKLGAEACDDGGVTAGDGCSEFCEVEQGWACDAGTCDGICGDGLIRGSEQCDDAGFSRELLDGCLDCQLEEKWSCSGEPSACLRTVVCGDGMLGSDELCDDGNLWPGDGCGRDCLTEPHFVCTQTSGSASACSPDGSAPELSDDVGIARPEFETSDFDPNARLDSGTCALSSRGSNWPLAFAALALLAQRIRRRNMKKQVTPHERERCDD